MGFSVISITQELFSKKTSFSPRTLNINSDYSIFTTSINDILSVKHRSLQTFATQWRYMFEIFSAVAGEKYQYIVLNNSLKKNDLSFRIYSQIFEGEQLIFF